MVEETAAETAVFFTFRAELNIISSYNLLLPFIPFWFSQSR